MPHELDDTTGVEPLLDRRDVAVVDPVVLGNIDLDEVIAVHGRIFTGHALHIVSQTMIPVHLGHDARDGLAAILRPHISQQFLGRFGSSKHRFPSFGRRNHGSFLGLEVQGKLWSRCRSVGSRNDSTLGHLDSIVRASNKR